MQNFFCEKHFVMKYKTVSATVVIKKVYVLHLKYDQPRSPDRCTFTVLLSCFYRTTTKPLTVLFSRD